MEFFAKKFRELLPIFNSLENEITNVLGPHPVLFLIELLILSGRSTGVEQRSRRAILLQRLLASSGFETDCRSDLINARIRHRPPGEMDEALFQNGPLMGYVNHPDLALVSDKVRNQYIDAFLAGNQGLMAVKINDITFEFKGNICPSIIV